jgi:hypothetical protein
MWPWLERGDAAPRLVSLLRLQVAHGVVRAVRSEWSYDFL